MKNHEVEDDQIYYDEEFSDQENPDDDDMDEHDQMDYYREPSQEDDHEDEDEDLETNQVMAYEEDQDDSVYYTLYNKKRKEKLQVYYQPPRKCPKISYNLDRISELSDDTILHILSFLPMEDAVKTGILSKRWQYLWTDSSILVFKNSSTEEDNISEFVNFVNCTLQLCTSRKINSFELEFFYLNSHNLQVGRWIRYLTLRKSENVCLRFLKVDEEDEYMLPQHLFNNSNLKILSLFNCIFIPTGDICWRLLKRLSLEHMELSDDVVAKILSGSRNLEFLKISSCCGVSFLDIHSESVKELVLQHTFGNIVDWSDETVLKISAPHLKSLELLGDFYKRRCDLVNVASLVQANVSFNCDFKRDNKGRYDYVIHLLQKLIHVEELELGIWCTEVLLTVEGNDFPFSKFRSRTLTLYTILKNLDSYLSIEALLYRFPDLEILKLDMGTHQIDFSSVYYPKENNIKKISRKVSKSYLSNLKKVHIINFSPIQEEFVLRLVKSILVNAKELEKLIIKTGNKGYYKWSSCSGSQKFIELIRKISSFRRCSPKAVVLF